MSTTKKRQPKDSGEVEVYGRGTNRRWRVVSPSNGKKMANGLQGYSRAEDLENGMIETAAAILRYFVGRRA